MASSGYTAITFVANEQPTTAKWNLIGSNDSSFNLGTGLEDGVILNRHLAVNAVGGNQLATSAILLASIKVTSSQTISTTAATLITGLSAAVTVPAGGRKVKITATLGSPYNPTAAGGMILSIWKTSVGGGTQLNSQLVEKESIILARGITCIAIDDSPAAGSITYAVGFSTSGGGTATTNAGATVPAMLLIELV